MGYVPRSGAQTGGLAVLPCDVRLHRLRAGNGRLDFEVSPYLPRVRSSDHGRRRGLLVLGTTHGRMCGWHVVAEILRQSQGADWRRGRLVSLFNRSLVWTRED